MNHQPEIQHAIEVVGPTQATDWRIEPTKHAAQFKESAPELAEILSRSDVDRTAQQYTQHDEEAIAAQLKFKQATEFAGWSVAGTAAAGALILCVGNFKDLFPSDTQHETIAFTFASVLMIVLGALATMWINRLRGGNLLPRWLQSRAEAERRRLEVFEAVIKRVQAQSEADAEAEANVKLDLLRFEYVRRFLLDSQLAYFRKRSSEHGAEAEKTLNLASWATGAATVFAGLAGCLSVINPYFAVLAALGIVAAAVATVAAGREDVNQDRLNAGRYAATRTSLEDLSKQLSTIREALAQGDHEVLDNFFAALREVLLAEHTQWLEESQRKTVAIDQLEEVLKKHTIQPATDAAPAE